MFESEAGTKPEEAEKEEAVMEEGVSLTEKAAVVEAGESGRAAEVGRAGEGGAEEGPGDGEAPLAALVLGMAGSGKTTLVHRLTSVLYSARTPPYVLNLDPAVRGPLKYPANIDIRDTVKYRDVMREYQMGPNGAILTSLNLFATKFDQVLRLLQKRKASTLHVLLDTPGQIEVFTWSASGQIVSEALASELPTAVLYVMDAERNTSPTTFMSNMLYACSILYKSRLPFVLALNKADLADPGPSVEWMRDWEAFQTALAKEDSYSSDLARSLSLVLDEFYAGLRAVAVSAKTGQGIPELLGALDEAKAEYVREYRPAYQRLLREKAAAETAAQAAQLERLRLDVDHDREALSRSELLRRQPGPKPSSGLPIDLRPPSQHHADGDDDGDDDGAQEEDDAQERKDYHDFKAFLQASDAPKKP